MNQKVLPNNRYDDDISSQFLNEFMNYTKAKKKRMEEIIKHKETGDKKKISRLSKKFLNKSNPKSLHKSK